MEESQSPNDSRTGRTRVLLKATLEVTGESLPVLLRDLSQDGALVSGHRLPPKGERVLFHRQGLAVPSQVKWVRRDQCGIEFDFPLFPRELLRHEPPGGRPPAASPPPWLFAPSD